MYPSDIKSMTTAEIAEWLDSQNEPKYRAEQIFKWLRSGIENFEQMSNISKALRDRLSENFYISGVFVKKKLESLIDNTVKYLYTLSQDNEDVEAVLMQYHYGYTMCISTQVGCRMGCSFCATGQSGFSRNLTASEMLNQIEAAQIDKGIRVSHVVMMGMGEPLDNFDNCLRFLELVSHKDGLNIGLRHITLSTCGIVSGIYKLMERNIPITLSISLHAPNDEIRNRLMPINKKWNIDELITASRDYVNTTKRRVSFEYAMFGGINDSDECAVELSSRLKGMLCHVNLIPANPVEGSDFNRSSPERVERFTNILDKKGIPATVRRTLGADIDASCGQLRRNNIHR